MAEKESIYEENRLIAKRARIKAQAAQAKASFKKALGKKSVESNIARGGRNFVKGVSSSFKTGSGKGIRGIVRLPQVSTGWSDMGLIAGSPFKDYRSRNAFPSSRPDRSLHPQEKAEIDAAIQKIRLFGVNPSQLSIDNRKKKENNEVL